MCTQFHFEQDYEIFNTINTKNLGPESVNLVLGWSRVNYWEQKPMT